MIEQYIEYLRTIRGYSENTCLAYKKDLQAFVQWLRTTTPGARWSSITRDDIDNYIRYRVEAGNKPATSNRILSSISGIYRYFQRQGKEIENPVKYESRRKQAKTIPNTIPVGQLQEAYKHSFGATKVMLGLLMTTGIRIQELLDMTWESINFENNSIKIEGKGSKQRLVYTTSEALEVLRTAHNISKARGKIFTLEQRELRSMIFNALRPYCTAKQLSPHAIRHTFATEIARKGENVSTLACILGHDSIKTTQKYIDVSSLNIRDAMAGGLMLN